MQDTAISKDWESRVSGSLGLVLRAWFASTFSGCGFRVLREIFARVNRQLYIICPLSLVSASILFQATDVRSVSRQTKLKTVPQMQKRRTDASTARCSVIRQAEEGSGKLPYHCRHCSYLVVVLRDYKDMLLETIKKEASDFHICARGSRPASQHQRSQESPPSAMIRSTLSS